MSTDVRNRSDQQYDRHARWVCKRDVVEPTNGRAGTHGAGPRVSVVIPTMNRPVDVVNCVRTLVDQTFVPQELVIVDNGELDDTALRRLADEAGMRYVFLRITHPGITRSRNLGVDEATGQYVLFLDDDTLLHRRYVEELLRIFAEDPHHEIGGVSGPGLERRWGAGRQVWEKLATCFCMRGTRRHEGQLLANGFPTPVVHLTEVTEVDHLRGGVAMWRRQLFEHDRFDEFFDGYGLGEDKEFSRRVFEKWRLVLNPHAKIYHLSSPSGRTNFLARGFQDPYNSYYIFKKLLPQTLTAKLMFAWACVGTVVLSTIWMILSPKRWRFEELLGVLKGIVHILWHRPFRRLQDTGPRRVMFVVTMLDVGGLERLVDVLIRRLDRTRFEPMLCCMKQADCLGEALAAEGVPVFEKLMAGKYDIRVLPRLIRILRREKVDVVCTVGSGGDRMFWGRLAAWMAGVPGIVASLHSMGGPCRIERLNRMLTGVTDAFVAVAGKHKDFLVREEGCPARRTTVIYNGVDSERWSEARPDAELASRLGLPHGVPVAGIVACFRPEKNHELFLRAAARALKQVPTAHFLIVGDGDRREELEALTAELDIASHVHFLGERHDVPELLTLMDVVVLPSDHEAFPVAVLEAQASGKPVVATNVGALSELVADGENGYLVEKGDERALADRLASLLSDRTTARRFGQAARHRVAKRFELRDMVTGYEQLFDAVADKANGCL